MRTDHEHIRSLRHDSRLAAWNEAVEKQAAAIFDREKVKSMHRSTHCRSSS